MMGGHLETITRCRASKLAVGIHEAGHAIASLALAPAPLITEVWIRRDPRGWAGCVEYVHRFQWEQVRQRANIPWADSAAADLVREHDRTQARKELLVSLAGPFAEARWRLRGRWPALFNGGPNAKIAVAMRHEASDDFGRSVDYLEWLGVNDLEAAFQDAWVETDELLRPYWRAVVHVGRMLRDNERITGEELAEAVSPFGLQ